jgi:phospholipid/cholesterol/gamma-HCH transport system substrate-binding protein
MDERVIQFRVGVMVLATLIITVILVWMFGQGSSRAVRGLLPGKRPYTVFIRFPEAPGVNTDTPIRKSGIVIGRVVSVDFADPQYQREVLVKAAIDRDRKLFTDEECQLVRTVVGDSRLEIVAKRRGGPPAETVQPNGEIPGTVISDPVQVVGKLEGDLRETIRSVGDASDELRKFVKSVNDLFGAEGDVPQRRVQLNELLRETRDTLKTIRTAAESANTLLGGGPDGDSQLRDTLRRNPRLVDKLTTTLTSVDGAVRSMAETMISARKNLDNLQRFTGPMGDRGNEIAQGLSSVTSNFDALLGEIRTLTARLNNQDGSLGKLIHDPSLYNNLNRAAENIQEISLRLRPVVEDVRVFTDKIARHPDELISIRGALQQRPGTKW